jgi:hypothetical protein
MNPHLTLTVYSKKNIPRNKTIIRGQDNELQENSVIRNFRITALGGKNYNTQH